MPRLRVLAGPSFSDLTPMQANDDSVFDIKTDAFEGKITVYIKGFADADGNIGDSPYFKQEERKDVTWSIQVQGRFLKEYSADDIMFGNLFDRHLNLPMGFSALLGFMQYIDPTLDQDLASSTKPWALSPLIATMPYFEHVRTEELHKVKPFPPIKPVGDDVSELPVEGGSEDLQSSGRKAYFKDAENRKKVKFGPEDVLTVDFCYGYLAFSPEGISLSLPAGLSFDMMRYWDGQPVRFACCERIPHGEVLDGNPWGRVFWCVAIEAIE